MEQDKDNRGRFAKKGSSERKIRSIRLTDETWNLLGEKAEENDMTKADYLEALANDEVDWKDENEVESNVDFDVEEVIELLQNAMTFKGNATKKIKLEIEKVLELMGVEIDELDGTD